MDGKVFKELGFMILVGMAIGVMFNVAMLGDPTAVGGILGGFVTGVLMYTFS